MWLYTVYGLQCVLFISKMFNIPRKTNSKDLRHTKVSCKKDEKPKLLFVYHVLLHTKRVCNSYKHCNITYLLIIIGSYVLAYSAKFCSQDKSYEGVRIIRAFLNYMPSVRTKRDYPISIIYSSPWLAIFHPKHRYEVAPEGVLIYLGKHCQIGLFIYNLLAALSYLIVLTNLQSYRPRKKLN